MGDHAGIGWFYVAAGMVNLLAAWRAWRPARSVVRAGAWLVVAGGFGVLASRAFQGAAPAMPGLLKTAVNALLGPVALFVSLLAALVVIFVGRRWAASPPLAWSVLNVSLLGLGLSLGDAHFAANVLKPDNIAVLGLVYLLAIMLWQTLSQAVANDRLLAEGQPVVERQYAAKTLVWPDLLYIELIAVILVTVLLVVWSLVLRAPLEEPANPVITPNPAKAPWYFVGFQELLVYADPWLAGVVVPGLIILGLSALPYVDRNPEGSGYYTIDRRRYVYAGFLFGFLMLWILPILVGTFLRGPNWDYYGPYEAHWPPKAVATQNVKLSEYFWQGLLGQPVPEVPDDAGRLARLGHILRREMAGTVLLAVYFLAIPPLLARTVLKHFYRQMGRLRYAVMTLLLLMMVLLPLKMVLRWTLNLSYLVSVPEYLFNI